MGLARVNYRWFTHHGFSRVYEHPSDRPTRPQVRRLFRGLRRHNEEHGGDHVTLALPSEYGSIIVGAGQTRPLPSRTREHARHIGFGEEPAFSADSVAL